MAGWVLNQAAQTAKRSPEFSATCTAITKRRGKKIATIAISRKLLTRACHLPRHALPNPAHVHDSQVSILHTGSAIIFPVAQSASTNGHGRAGHRRCDRCGDPGDARLATAVRAS